MRRPNRCFYGEDGIEGYLTKMYRKSSNKALWAYFAKNILGWGGLTQGGFIRGRGLI